MSGVGNYASRLNPDLIDACPGHPRSQLEFKPSFELGALFGRQVDDIWMSAQHIGHP